jgi:hypothetical protein
MQSGRVNAILTGSRVNKDIEQRNKQHELDEQMGKDAEELIHQMTDAAQKDRDSYALKKPALAKLFMAPHVYDKLKNLYLQEKFLDLKGTTCLIQWLEPLVLNVYPNVNLQQGVLECLDKLNV